MEETKTATQEPCHKQGSSGCSETVQTERAESNRPLDADRLREDPMPEKSHPADNLLVEQLSKQLDNISDDIKRCRKQLSHLALATDELRAADQIIADLSTRYRDLNERFHEREVLLPVVCSLIRLADSCLQQIRKYEQLPAKPAGRKKLPDKKAVGFVVDSRRADLVQVEQTLANLGVESFEHEGRKFDPSVQKCISRIESEDRAREGYVAQRLLPGYKRDGRVIRKEYVSVYVLNNKSLNAKNGGNQKCSE